MSKCVVNILKTNKEGETVIDNSVPFSSLKEAQEFVSEYNGVNFKTRQASAPIEVKD